jgi:hypothetical protein
MFERRHEVGEGRARQARERRLFESLGHDAVEAAHVTAGLKVQVPGDFVGNAQRLDDLAVHVSDIQGAVRGVGHEHRAKPSVLGSEELDLLLVERPFGARGRPGMHDFFVVHDVLRRIGDKRVAHVFPRKGIAPVNGQTARRRKIT